MEEFADYKQDLILGASFAVTAPLGQYDSGQAREHRDQPLVVQT